MIDLNQFYAWQAEKPETRKVTIEIENNGEARIFVYDKALKVGNFVVSAEDINLEDEADEKEIKRYMELKAKFEKEAG